MFGNLFKSFTSSASSPAIASLSLDQLDQQSLPILSAEELIQLLGQFNPIRTIKALTALDDKTWNQLYLSVIHDFVERAQLIPASAAYHHTEPGGLIVHTLDVVARALSARQRYILPLLSDPAVQQAERHVWTYAIFIGALLHDAGKMLSQQKILLENYKKHSPFEAYSTYQNQNLHYRIESIQDSNTWRLHQQFSLAFFGCLVPEEAQAWLGAHRHILDELSAWLIGKEDDWGSIGMICRQADSQSVAESFGLHNTTRFVGAQPPLSERMMIAIRHVLPKFSVNKPGAAIFKRGKLTFLMSKAVIDAARNYLKEHGDSSVPEDNNRLFDELAQFGMIYRTQEGKAIWRIQVQILEEAFDQTFSVLAVETTRLFHATNVPPDLRGTLVVNPQAAPKSPPKAQVQEQSPQLQEKSEPAPSQVKPAVTPYQAERPAPVDPTAASETEIKSLGQESEGQKMESLGQQSEVQPQGQLSQSGQNRDSKDNTNDKKSKKSEEAKKPKKEPETGILDALLQQSPAEEAHDANPATAVVHPSPATGGSASVTTESVPAISASKLEEMPEDEPIREPVVPQALEKAVAVHQIQTTETEAVSNLESGTEIISNPEAETAIQAVEFEEDEYEPEMQVVDEQNPTTEAVIRKDEEPVFAQQEMQSKEEPVIARLEKPKETPKAQVKDEKNPHKEPLPTAPDTVLDPDIANIFLDWVRHGIRTRKFEINDNNSPVHLIPMTIKGEEQLFLGLLSPAIFMQFCKDYQLQQIAENERPWARVQSMLVKKKINLKNGKMDVHYFKARNRDAAMKAKKPLAFMLLKNSDHYFPYGVKVDANRSLVKI